MPNERPPSSDRGFAIFISSLALLISMGAMLAVAFRLNDTNSGGTAAMPMMSGGYTPAGNTTTSEEVKIVVKSDEEHGKKGSDGNWHDAFLPADFSVKAGATVHVVVENYDDAEHSFTAPDLGMNVTIPGGSETKASVTNFTFRAPAKAGSYEWFCAIPCDPWAMNHDGFMRGVVSVA
jgi:plastocyanin